MRAITTPEGAVLGTVLKRPSRDLIQPNSYSAIRFYLPVQTTRWQLSIRRGLEPLPKGEALTFASLPEAVRYVRSANYNEPVW